MISFGTLGIKTFTIMFLSNFNLAKLKNAYGMFNGCSNLEKIIFGNTIASSLENMGITFL